MWVQSLGQEDPWKRVWQPIPEFLPGESQHCLAAMTVFVTRGRQGSKAVQGLGSCTFSVQFSHSVVSDCDPMDCSTPGFPIHHQLPELTQTHVYQVMMPSNHLIPVSSCFQSFPAAGSFPVSLFFASGGQSIGVSASTSVLPMNTQD